MVASAAALRAAKAWSTSCGWPAAASDFGCVRTDIGLLLAGSSPTQLRALAAVAVSGCCRRQVRTRWAARVGYSAPADADGAKSAVTGSERNGHRFRKATSSWISPVPPPVTVRAHRVPPWLHKVGWDHPAKFARRGTPLVRASASPGYPPAADPEAGFTQPVSGQQPSRLWHRSMSRVNSVFLHPNFTWRGAASALMALRPPPGHRDGRERRGTIGSSGSELLVGTARVATRLASDTDSPGAISSSSPRLRRGALRSGRRESIP